MGQSGTTVARPSALVEAIEQLTRALAQIAALPATPLLRREQIKHQVVSGARAIGQSQERSKTPLLFRVPPLSLARKKGHGTRGGTERGAEGSHARRPAGPSRIRPRVRVDFG